MPSDLTKKYRDMQCACPGDGQILLTGLESPISNLGADLGTLRRKLGRCSEPPNRTVQDT